MLGNWGIGGVVGMMGSWMIMEQCCIRLQGMNT